MVLRLLILSAALGAITLLPPSPVIADAPLPTSAPTTASVAQRFYDQLQDTDPLLREQAVEELMGLDLASLRGLIQEQQSFSTLQIEYLEDIIVQVHATQSHGYAIPEGEWTEIRPRIGIRAFTGNDVRSARAGVVIDQCSVGYDTHRYLRPGDRLTGVREPGKAWQEVNQLEDLRGFLTRDMIGRQIEIRFVRDALPRTALLRVGEVSAANGENIESRSGMLDNLREHNAQVYWKNETLPDITRRIKP
jgi:hypothetical protein